LEFNKMTFQSVFGADPDVIAAAPGRVNLIGEHVDYSDGYVLPFAISSRTTVSIKKRPDQKIRLASAQRNTAIFETSISDLKPKSDGKWERYPLGVIWVLGIKEGLDIYVDGKVPLGAGLSSSAALECSVATALNALFNLNLDLKDLARATQRAENEFVGVPCGIMDQSISLMGKAGHALLLDCRDLSTKLVKMDLAESNLELLIIDTQAHHSLVDGGYAERRAACESAAAKLGKSMRELSLEELEAGKSKLTETEYRRARHAVTEIARVVKCVTALESKDFDLVGDLINKSHASLRDDYNVSCPELDVAVDAAIAAGAIGARMVGGGFGGSAIALVKQSEIEKTKTAVMAAFASNGFKAPRFFESLPSQGAELILN
jgi:galactokinase